MTVVFCPSNDDEHGAFPHRLVITAPRAVWRRVGRTKSVCEIIPPQVFVICAICDHMTSRAVFGCVCPQKCHAQARADLASAAQRDVS